MHQVPMLSVVPWRTFSTRCGLVRACCVFVCVVCGARVHRCFHSPSNLPLRTMVQGEPGVSCPMSMTFACVPALEHQLDLAAEWGPALCSASYDPTDAPLSEKTGATMGMSMTEKQGGSDVRANTTRATPMATATGGGAAYTLVGHKWFTSAPMCDAFLTLAYTDEV